jgi:hypothetical protein
MGLGDENVGVGIFWLGFGEVVYSGSTIDELVAPIEL